MKNTKVGELTFDKKTLDVYSSLDTPLFRLSDVATLIEYSQGNTWNLLNLCEPDEKIVFPITEDGLGGTYITEMGLYSILSQSRKPIARKWRRLVHQELIDLRKSRNMDILQRFDEWNDKLSDIYFDPETGIIMQSVTVEGGDVEQYPYDGEAFWEK